MPRDLRHLLVHGQVCQQIHEGMLVIALGHDISVALFPDESTANRDR